MSRTHLRTLILTASILSGTSWAVTASAQPPQECSRASAEAQKLRKQNKLVESRDELLRCSQSDCAPQIRKDCEKRLHDLEAQMPTLVVTAKDEAGRPITEGTVSIDERAVATAPDGKPIFVNPGSHVVSLTPRSGGAMRQSVLVHDKDRGHAIAFAITLPTSGSASSSSGAPEDKPSGHTAGPWIPGVAGALMTAGGAISLLSAKSAGAGPYLIGGAGLVSLGGGVGWYFAEQSSPAVRKAAPWITAGYGGAMIAAGVVTAIARSARPSDSCDTTDPSYRACEDDYAKRKAEYNGVTGAEALFFVVGGASVAIGATWAVLDGSSSSKTSSTGVKVMAVPGGVIGTF